MSEFAQLVSAFAWPLFIYCSALLFRSELKSLAGRITRASKDGVEFSPVGAQPTDPASRLGEHLKVLVPNIAASPIAHELASQLQQTLNGLWPMQETEKREAILLANLADARLTSAAYRIYLDIFRSQLDALYRIAAQGGALATTQLMDLHAAHAERVRQVFGDGADANPHLTFEAWLGFLANNNLVGIHDGRCVLTDAGRTFMSFLQTTNLPRFQNF